MIADDTFALTFAAPPSALALLANGVGVCSFIAGGVAAIVIIRALPQAWDRSSLVFPGLLFVVCAIFGSWTWRRTRHLVRFGGLPVKISIVNGQLIMVDPPQWGLLVRAVPLENVTRCYAEFAGWSLTGQKIYRINFCIRDRGGIEMCVAAHEDATVGHAVTAIQSRLRQPNPT